MMDIPRITKEEMKFPMTLDIMKSIEELVSKSAYRGKPGEIILDPVREIAVRSLLDMYEIGMETVTLEEAQMAQCKRFIDAANGSWEISQRMMSKMMGPKIDSEAIPSTILFCDEAMAICDRALERLAKDAPSAVPME